MELRNRPLFVFLVALAPFLGHANDLTISDPSITSINTTAGHLNLRFDIAWQNSWRTTSDPGNWDAAWVFAKFRNGTTGLWEHARLHGDAGHVAPAGCTVSTGLLIPGSAYDMLTNWGAGVFIHRSADGTGPFSANGVELRWDFIQNGVALGDIVDVKLFALEMVYMPQASFFVGSGGSESASFTNGSWVSGATIPLQISSEGALTIAQTPGALWGTMNSGNGAIGGAGTLPASYPKGFAAAYMMKYEVPQGAYVDFLNTLTRTQQSGRVGTSIPVGTVNVTNRYVMSNSATLLNRNGIRCDATIDANGPVTFYCDLDGDGVGNEFDDGVGVACNFMNWGDLTAYLDWSGLRPMTELEYEKACRGPAAAVPNAYAWGNTFGFQANALLAPGTPNEQGTGGNANAWNAPTTTFNGPIRVGSFATATSNRAAAGAGYYGALDLSGNTWERTVTVGNAVGRAFTGSHGDGTPSPAGDHNETNWPPPASASGGRGGPSPPTLTHLRTSDRAFATSFGSTRNNNFGGRGIRTAP